MEDLAKMFQKGSKVVISPDEMRAWVMLPKPQKNCPYTLEGLREWLLQNGVTVGIRDDMLKTALQEREDDKLLEVARGIEVQEGKDGHLTFHIQQKVNASVRTASDGGLILDDLSFLHEVKAGAVIADIVPPVLGVPGRSVNGKELPSKHVVSESAELLGYGFQKSEDGLHYIAPVQSHIRFVDKSVQLTPVLYASGLCAEDGPLHFEGDIVIDGDVLTGSVIKAGQSVYVSGRCQDATIEAERNIVLCGGLSSLKSRGALSAKESILGLFFEQASLKAGRDVCASHLRGCEVTAGGHVRILGKQGLCASSAVRAKEGFVCQNLGGEGNSQTEVHVGLEKQLIQRGLQVSQNIEKRTQEVQQISQNISTFERLNRQKPNGGKDLADYKEMVSKKEGSLRVLNMLEKERQSIKRKMDGLSAAGVIVRDKVYPGVLISIDTREYIVDRKWTKVRFKREGEAILMTTNT